jgi:HAD superfamily hydrolase (TIGR01509 family)
MSPGTAPRGAVVFDCDGTLVETAGAWHRAYSALFAAHERVFEPAAVQHLVGMPLERLGHALAEMFGQPARHRDFQDRMIEMVRTNGGTPIRPMPGAIALVRALSGTRPMAVASNTPRVIVAEYLAAVGLDGAFDAVLGCDDVEAPKPAADIYLAACRRLGTPPAETVAIEDCPVGAAAARAAGLYLVRLDPSGGKDRRADLMSADLRDACLWRALGLGVAEP